MSEVTQYPVTVKVEIHITDGHQVGSASYVHGHGVIPTEDEMAAILKRVEGTVPEDFRLMDRAESTMFYLREERGYRGPNLVVPKSGKWHDPATDKEFTSIGDQPEVDDFDEF